MRQSRSIRLRCNKKNATKHFFSFKTNGMFSKYLICQWRSSPKLATQLSSTEFHNPTIPMNNHDINVQHNHEVSTGQRFSFGANWRKFLAVLDDVKVKQAVDSLKNMLNVENLNGKSFLDVGSGSGLFSLAARKLGACVYSFDYDPESVACTMELKHRYFRDDTSWTIQNGSVLDAEYLRSLGVFDVVYSWGVLHHTGDMWSALSNVDTSVAPDGLLFIALYNHQPFASKYWTCVKRIYNQYRISRPILVLIHFMYPTIPSIVLKWVQGRSIPRGMNVIYDLYDWLGGYPFEVSTPEQILNFFNAKGYKLQKIKTVGGKMGCNEYVFSRCTLQ
jgi:2-polyprenyl-3-methyl-5-hydroxy-6-metoxy-1,4-benzoquinol methylase